MVAFEAACIYSDELESVSEVLVDLLELDISHFSLVDGQHTLQTLVCCEEFGITTYSSAFLKFICLPIQHPPSDLRNLLHF